ncbi:putative amidohydrolase protein [Rhypophila sp. PSN 637]
MAPSPPTETYIAPVSPPYQPKFIIINVRVFNGRDVLPGPYDVTISHGVISSMVVSTESSSSDTGSPIPTVDGTNKTLLPGLIDSHVHITHSSQLDMLISSGITTIFDMGCFPPALVSSIREACVLSDEPTAPVRPEFHSAGMPATTSDSNHAKMLPFPSESPIFLDRNSPGKDVRTHVKRWVQNRIEEGSEYIKIIADVPGPTQEMIHLLVQEARNQGKKSVAHAASLEAWKMAQDAGVDLITHVPFDGILSEQATESLANHGGVEKVKAAVPTLTMSKAIAQFQRGTSQGERDGLVNMVMELSFGSVKEVHKAERNGQGVVVLAGTDANDLPFSKVKHGESLIEELELLVNGAGYSPVEALRVATSVPATWWGLGGKGVIEVGAKADLLLVGGQPWDDVGALRNVVGVWREGRASFGGLGVMLVASTFDQSEKRE